MSTAKKTGSKASKGFTAEERAAMRERARKIGSLVKKAVS